MIYEFKIYARLLACILLGFHSSITFYGQEINLQNTNSSS